MHIFLNILLRLSSIFQNVLSKSSSSWIVKLRIFTSCKSILKASLLACFRPNLALQGQQETGAFAHGSSLNKTKHLPMNTGDKSGAWDPFSDFYLDFGASAGGDSYQGSSSARMGGSGAFNQQTRN